MGALSLARSEARQLRAWPRQALLAVAGAALLIGAIDVAEAAKARTQRQVASIETRDGGEPVMAI
jgi:hypothetical protein